MTDLSLSGGSVEPTNLRTAVERVAEDIRRRSIWLSDDTVPSVMPWIDAHRLHKDEPYIGCPFCQDEFVPTRRVASWFAHNIIADEVGKVEPLPAELRDAIAAEMVADQDKLGWPDIETAQATLDDWKWA